MTNNNTNDLGRIISMLKAIKRPVENCYRNGVYSRKVQWYKGGHSYEIEMIVCYGTKNIFYRYDNESCDWNVIQDSINTLKGDYLC